MVKIYTDMGLAKEVSEEIEDVPEQDTEKEVVDNSNNDELAGDETQITLDL